MSGATNANQKLCFEFFLSMSVNSITRPSSPVWQVRRVSDHFFGRVCFPPSPFSRFGLFYFVLTSDFIQSVTIY